MITVLLVSWIGLAVAVSVAADSRGRSGAAWFFTALLISPLFAVIILLAMPYQVSKGATAGAFVPEGILQGIPYRTGPDGTIVAMAPGGRVIFKDHQQFAAFAAGGTVEGPPPEVMKNYPEFLNGFRYRIEKKAVVAFTPMGEEVRYPDWKSFWAAAHNSN